MHNRSRVFRTGKIGYMFFGTIGLILLFVTVGVGRAFLLGNATIAWQDVFVLVAVTAVMLANAIVLYTAKLTLEDDTLTYRRIFYNHSVHLNNLVRAKIRPAYFRGGRMWNYHVLRLEDSTGGTVQFTLDWFYDPGYLELVALLKPYIFRTTVDRNFLSLGL